MKLLAIIACLFTLGICAQTAKLHLIIYLPVNQEGYSIHVLSPTDTLHTFEYTGYTLKDFDSLAPGSYELHIYDKAQSGFIYFSKQFMLKDNKVTDVNVTLNSYITIYEPPVESESFTEMQISAGYFNGGWMDQSMILKNNFFMGLMVSNATSFGKHVKVLIGSGFSFSQHYFSKDTSLFAAIPFQRKYERYASINLDYEMKVRFTTGNYKSRDDKSSKFLIDLGAGYRFPLIFNHTALFHGRKKIVDRGIHQFKDFRAFVNVGYSSVSVFAEYRIVDFLLGSYPELPRYNFGVKFIIEDMDAQEPRNTH